jgi:hypothetical protein
VKLDSAIVVSTDSKEFDFAPIPVQLVTRHSATVRLDINREELRGEFLDVPAGKTRIVSVAVKALLIDLTLDDVNEADIKRLQGRQLNEPTFQATFKTNQGILRVKYQEAGALAKTVVANIRGAANTVLHLIRDLFGQHWLTLVQASEHQLQEFIDDARAEWQVDGSDWQRLVVVPLVSMITAYSGVGRMYLNPNDWRVVGTTVATQAHPPYGLTLLSDARERFRRDDREVAIIHLNSAVEWAVQEFLRVKLAGHIPARSLDAILETAHARLLDTWILPYSDQMGLGLRENEWPAIRQIQQLRKKAAHPADSAEIESLSEAEFTRLVRSAASTIAKLCSLAVPKLPPPMEAIMAREEWPNT